MDEVDERLKCLEDEVARLRDLEAIREVLYRYCRAVDHADVDMLRTVFHPGAFEIHPPAYVGDPLESAEGIAASLRQLTSTRHMVTNPMIELAGDRAFSESQYIYTARVPLGDGVQVDMHSEGRYLDVLERRNGAWGIAYRMLVNEKRWTRAVSELDAWNDNSEVPAGCKPVIGPEDPVYRSFDIERTRPSENFEPSNFMARVAAAYASPEAGQ
jgi:hypothetical protein